MRHRHVLACSVVLAVASAVLLSRPSPSVSAPIPEADHSAQRSTTSSVTTITTDTIVIPTYPYAAFLYTATNTTYNIPYQWLHWAQYQGSHPQPVNKTYTRLTLENEWLRVSLLPELGGRIYEMIFKPTGNNELYRNTVIKPTHWGPSEQGWWLAAGGIEWGLPVEEHGYESAIPWMYDVITGSNGITVTLRDSLQPDRLRAAIAVFLPDDRAVLIIRPRVENDRSATLNFKWWINAMLAPGPGNSIGKAGTNPNGTDLRLVYPETEVTVHSTGDSTLPQAGQAMTWPIYKNRDMSRLQNWNQSLGFFARPLASQDFVGVIDLAHREGIARIFPKGIATGSKDFAMGWQNPIGAGNWTDDDSYYMEVHGGLAPTFWDTAPIAAHGSLEWEETWYPFSGLKDLTTANREAALHAERTGSALNIGVYSTRARNDSAVTVWRRSTCQTVAAFPIASIDPAAAQQFSVTTSLPLDDLAVIFHEKQVLLISYQGQDCVPPTTSLSVPSNVMAEMSFPVVWTGTDFYSGIAAYDVQFKDGYWGAWTDWLTTTTSISGTFDGVDGHTYFFRVRARDLAGNESRYTASPFGDGFTSVLVTPAPVLETSIKGVAAPLILQTPIGWSIDLWNAGTLSTTATLTDTLPLYTSILTDALRLNGEPAPQLYIDGQIRWSDVVTENAHVVITYHLTPTLPLTPGTTLINTAIIAYDDRLITRTAHTTQPYHAFLPVILR